MSISEPDDVLPSPSPPSLCGCIPADDKYKCKPSDQVCEHWYQTSCVSTGIRPGM